MVENFKVLASPSTARLFSAWIEKRLANNRVARHLTFRYGGSFHTLPYLSRNIPQFLIGVGGHKTNNILVEWLAPKGFSISNRIRSRASQNETAASNGGFRRSSARNLVRDTGFLTTSVPAAPTFTTSYRSKTFACMSGSKSRRSP